MSSIRRFLEESVFGKKRFLMIEILDYQKHCSIMIEINKDYFRKKAKERSERIKQ